MNKRTIFLSALSVTLSAPALAEISLELRPADPTVVVGDTVNLGLYAVSDDATDQLLSAVQVILTWDPAFLELLGNDDTGGAPLMVSDFPVPDPFNLNETDPPPPADGDGLYIGLTALGAPVAATPAGTLLTRFQFLALQETLTPTPVGIPATCRAPQCATIVFDGTIPNTPVTGTLSGVEVEVESEGPPPMLSITVDIDIGCDLIQDVADGQMIDFLCLGEDHDGENPGNPFSGAEDDDDSDDGDLECGFEFIKDVLKIRSDVAILMITCSDGRGQSTTFMLDMALAGLEDDGDDDSDSSDDDSDSSDDDSDSSDDDSDSSDDHSHSEDGGTAQASSRPTDTPPKEPDLVDDDPRVGGADRDERSPGSQTSQSGRNGLSFLWLYQNCPADLDRNLRVNKADLALLLEAWGPCPPGDEPCRADLAPDGGDRMVDALDFVELLLNLGPCF